jgi:hypothetical protein
LWVIHKNCDCITVLHIMLILVTTSHLFIHITLFILSHIEYSKWNFVFCFVFVAEGTLAFVITSWLIMQDKFTLLIMVFHLSCLEIYFSWQHYNISSLSVLIDGLLCHFNSVLCKFNLCPTGTYSVNLTCKFLLILFV